MATLHPFFICSSDASWYARCNLVVMAAPHLQPGISSFSLTYSSDLSTTRWVLRGRVLVLGFPVPLSWSKRDRGEQRQGGKATWDEESTAKEKHTLLPPPSSLLPPPPLHFSPYCLKWYFVPKARGVAELATATAPDMSHAGHAKWKIGFTSFVTI